MINNKYYEDNKYQVTFLYYKLYHHIFIYIQYKYYYQLFHKFASCKENVSLQYNKYCLFPIKH